jgi:ribose 5-phosphate isomerase A
LKIIGIPTSIATEELARKLGIPLTTLDQHPEIDITIDGADEIDPKLNLIKGGGGALLREKVVASVTKKMVVVADSSKVVRALGKFPLPVEIIPFARPVVERKLASLGATSTLRLKPDGQPYLTDNGNHILDASFGKIADPPAVARSLSETPGVVEHGLFIGFAKVALIGQDGAVREVHKRHTRKKRVQRKHEPRRRQRQTKRLKS